MKKIRFSLLLLLLTIFPLSAQTVDFFNSAPQRKTASFPAQRDDWVSGPGPEWNIYYETALAKAAAEHKKIYVLNTGSDWCGWCIKLRNDVLTSPRFKQFAKENLVLLYLDSPRKKKLPPDQTQHNNMVRSLLHFGGGVPSAKILDENGRIVAERSGYAAPDTYMAFLQQAVGGPAVPPVNGIPPENSGISREANFRIVAWGKGDRSPDQPYHDSMPIAVQAGTKVNVKLKYEIPADKRFVIFLQTANNVSVSAPFFFFRGSGEIVYSLFSGVPCECPELILKISVPGQQKELEELKIPCRIAWKESMPEQTSDSPSSNADWVPGPDPDWETRYEAALERAAEEHKKIYVLNTGSDWCGWCIKLREDVLTNPKFRKFAKENLVLLYLDSPRQKALPPEQIQHNNKVRTMLRFSGGVPSAKILDEEGRIVAERSGYADLDAYMDFLKNAMRSTSASFSAAEEKRIDELRKIVRKAKFKIVSWGKGPAKPYQPFRSSELISVPAGTPVSFKIRYELPKDLRSQIFLRAPNVSVSSPSGLFQGRGEVVQFLNYTHPYECTSLQIKMRIAGHSDEVVAAEIPCRIIWKR